MRQGPLHIIVDLNVRHKAARDMIADICRADGVSVPEQVQVIGVDDEEYICELTVPSLSSIAPDFETSGYRAAREAFTALLHRYLLAAA